MAGYSEDHWKRSGPALQADFLVREHIPEWLGDVTGKRVLDAGCGEGYVSRLLARRNARVSGFDQSTKMIELATAMEERELLGIDYRVAAIAETGRYYNPESFDIVILSGVAYHLDPEELRTSVETLATKLRTGGRFLLATNNLESYVQQGKSGWVEFFTKTDGSKTTQRVGLHYRTADKVHAYSGEGYFHSQDDLERAFTKAGLRIHAVHEPLATPSDTAHFPHMWGDEARIPYHLIIIATKEK